jgi:hypothetical protein
MIEWISVHERLPADLETVCMFSVDGDIEVGTFHNDPSGAYLETELVDYFTNEMTHWIPLPKPPQ